MKKFKIQSKFKPTGDLRTIAASREIRGKAALIL